MNLEENPAIQPAQNTGIQLDIPLPGKFEGANSPQQAELWPKWLKRFERYRVASGLKNKPNADQVSILLYSMGDCADYILSTLTVNEEIDTYDDVKTALDEYFKVRRNVICERARFNKRTQSPGEPVDTFIQDLYKLSESCDYGNLREDLIRDRIVVGVYTNYSDALSDTLQAKSDLSLKKAIELSRQAEARKHNLEYVRENTAATNKTVDYVKPAHAINKHKAGAKPKAKNYPTADSSTTTRTHSCKWCGRSRHDRRHCPAREAICRNCQRKGHFHSVCRGEKVVNRVNEVQQLGSVDLPYLGYVGAKCDNKHIFVEIDVPYSGDNGENCVDEQISAQNDVPYSGHNAENCADEQISAQNDDAGLRHPEPRVFSTQSTSMCWSRLGRSRRQCPRKHE